MGFKVVLHNKSSLRYRCLTATDFYYLASRRRTLLEYYRYYEVNKANATTARINIGHAPKFGVQKLLSVEVQKYPGNDIGDRFFKVGRVGGSNHSLYTAEHYMIVKSSLPRVEQLDLWGRELVQANCALDPHTLKSAMDSMLIRYCKVNKNLRIVGCYRQGRDSSTDALPGTNSRSHLKDRESQCMPYSTTCQLRGEHEQA